jgi:anthranilate synthase component 1
VLYRRLRQVNPSPYMFFMRLPRVTLLGSSPELLIRCRDGELTTCPIAGTRHRSADPVEDDRLAEELLADPKERAEHVMLVDLGRNDLGRMAEKGTVKVEKFRASTPWTCCNAPSRPARFRARPRCGPWR